MRAAALGGVCACGLVLAAGLAAAGSTGETGETRADSGAGWGQRTYPSAKQLASAREYAAGRSSSVAFAVIGPGAGARGIGVDTQFSSASVSKALLLAGYLRSHKGEIDAGTRSQLEAMVTASDNSAADAIYAIVGDEGMERVAQRAGMDDFEATPGFWGGVQITAADMARFFFRLDHNLAGPHRRYGKRLLASVIEPERWGIPVAAGKGWRIWFKGGWRPGGDEENSSGPVSHQAALLRYRNGVEVAICVLSHEAPGEGGGYTTIEGIASRLIDPPPRSGRWPAS